MKKALTKTDGFGIAGVLVLAAIWGLGTPLTKYAYDCFHPLWVIAIELTIGAAVMWIANVPKLKQINKSTLIAGILPGVFLFLSLVTMDIGLAFTTATKGGFYANITAVFIPFMMWIFKRNKIRVEVIVSVVICAVGAFFMSGAGNDGFSLNMGDILCLVSSVCLGCQTIATDEVLNREDNPVSPTLFVPVELTAGAILAVPCAFIVTGAPAFADVTTNTLMSVLYLGMVNGGISYLLLAVAQNCISPEKVGVCIAFQPLFSALFSRIVLGETMGVSGTIGGIMIVFSLIYIEAGYKLFQKSKKKDSETIKLE